MKIEKLTSEQEEKLKLYAQMGIEKGLSCDPIDEDAARTYSKKLMDWLGRDYEGTIIVDSPLAACCALPFLKIIENTILPAKPDQVQDQVWDQVRDQVWDQVRAQVGDQVREQVWDQVLGQVWGQVRDQVRDQVWDQVQDQVLDQVRAQVWAQVQDQVRDQVGGQVRAQVGDQVRAQVLDQVRDQVRAQVWDQVGDQVWDQVGDQVGDQVWDQVWEQVQDQVREQVQDQVRAQVWDQVLGQVRDQVSAQVWDQVQAQVRDQVGDQVRDQVRAQVGDQVRDQVRAQVREQVWAAWPYMDGQWYSYYAAWHNYFRDVLKITLPDIWMIEDQVQFGCVYPLGKFVVISRRPECIRLNAAGRLHYDGGAAVRYADGFSVFALNGVRVPEWLAVENEKDIDPAKFAELDNAEIRREFIRKVGIERIYQSCGGTVKDRQGDYELVHIDLKGQTGLCPYLKMKNPSIGVWHLEGVPKGTATVAEALRWRNQSDLTPVQLT